jgi:hypothetical protein
MQDRLPSRYLRPVHTMILGHRRPGGERRRFCSPGIASGAFRDQELTVENLRRLVSMLRHSGKLE